MPFRNENDSLIEQSWDEAQQGADSAPLAHETSETPKLYVRIRSDEHGVYWREGGHGYTHAKEDAWVLPLREASERTEHCGPEKKIVFQPVPSAEVPRVRSDRWGGHAKLSAHVALMKAALEKIPCTVRLSAAAGGVRCGGSRRCVNCRAKAFALDALTNMGKETESLLELMAELFTDKSPLTDADLQRAREVAREIGMVADPPGAGSDDPTRDARRDGGVAKGMPALREGSGKMKFSNQLTDAQAERLAILLEEMGEAQQIIGKILRHGYNSYNPDAPEKGTNRVMLERELGDVAHAVRMLGRAEDISEDGVSMRIYEKSRTIAPYLHHQGTETEADPPDGGSPANK